MTTGENIKAARKAKGMTQAELAEKLDVPFQSISQWERDIRNPKHETLEKISRILDTTPAMLRGFRTSDELIDLYIQGAKKWAMDFRFSEDQKDRISELLAEYALRVKQLINEMANTPQVDGRIPVTPELQNKLDAISTWAFNSLKYVNNDYFDNPQV